jgi:hypothetical protein
MSYVVAGWSASLGVNFDPSWLALSPSQFPVPGFFAVSPIASGSACGCGFCLGPAWSLFGGSGLPGFDLVPVGIPQETFTNAGFVVRISNGGVTINGYTGPGGEVVIPSTINDLPVIAIGDFAFFSNPGLSSITIPSGITSIGMDAFAGCTGLTCATIPDSVTNLSDAAFASCDGLVCVTIGNGVANIAANDFAECTKLTSVLMGNSLTSIGQKAFIDCHSLTNLVFPNTLTNVGDMAFQFCTSLTSVVIPTSVASLGDQAFCCCFSLTNLALLDGLRSIGDFALYRCTNLTKIIIPSGVTNIGIGAFSGCTSLAAIDVDALNPMYSSADGVLFNKAQTELVRYPPAKAGKYWIPSSVTIIGEFAFDSYSGLTGVLTPRFALNNSFGFTISWPTNAPVVIEATPNFTPPTWFPISTNTLASGSGYFTDPQWTNYPSRFYRLRPP